MEITHEKRKEIIKEVEELKHKRMHLAKEIAKRKKDDTDAASPICLMRQVSARIKELDEELGEVEKQLAEEIVDKYPDVKFTIPIRGMKLTEEQKIGYRDSGMLFEVKGVLMPADEIWGDREYWIKKANRLQDELVALEEKEDDEYIHS